MVHVLELQRPHRRRGSDWLPLETLCRMSRKCSCFYRFFSLSPIRSLFLFFIIYQNLLPAFRFSTHLCDLTMEMIISQSYSCSWSNFPSNQTTGHALCDMHSNFRIWCVAFHSSNVQAILSLSGIPKRQMNGLIGFGLSQYGLIPKWLKLLVYWCSCEVQNQERSKFCIEFSMQKLQSWQGRDHNSALAQLEESRLFLIQEVTQYQGRSPQVLQELNSLFGNGESGFIWNLKEKIEESGKKRGSNFVVSCFKILVNPWKWHKAAGVAVRLIAASASISSTIHLYRNRQEYNRRTSQARCLALMNSKETGEKGLLFSNPNAPLDVLCGRGWLFFLFSTLTLYSPFFTLKWIQRCVSIKFLV